MLCSLNILFHSYSNHAYWLSAIVLSIHSLACLILEYIWCLYSFLGSQSPPQLKDPSRYHFPRNSRTRGPPVSPWHPLTLVIFDPAHSIDASMVLVGKSAAHVDLGAKGICACLSFSGRAPEDISRYPHPVIQHGSPGARGMSLFGRQIKPTPFEPKAGLVSLSRARSLEKRFGMWYFGWMNTFPTVMSCSKPVVFSL